MDELTKLRESLKSGECAFKILSPAERDELQAMVDEQHKNGKNPWGKRKRRSDAGQPKKKRKTSAPIVRPGSTEPVPPTSCNSSDYQEAQDNMLHDAFDYDDISNSGTCPEDELPRKVIQKRSLKVAYRDDESESGEDEVGWGGDGPIKDLARSIELWGDGQDDRESE